METISKVFHDVERLKRIVEVVKVKDIKLTTGDELAFQHIDAKVNQMINYLLERLSNDKDCKI